MSWRHWLVVVAAGSAACSGPDPVTLECPPGTTVTGVLTAGGRLEVPAGPSKDLAGAALAAQTGTTLPGQAASIACAADIAPAGTVALGPAVSFGPGGFASDRPFKLTLPYKTGLLPAGAGRRHVRVVARRTRGDGVAFYTPVANLALDDADPSAARASFSAEELVTYQVVALADAGTRRTRRFTYRAIAGVSMGGGAASAIALRHPERWDLVGALGGEPGPDLVYTLTMAGTYLFGGFCVPGPGMCPSAERKPWADQHELQPDYEHFTSQTGLGVGLTLDRHLYMKATRDLARAFGNPTLYNPASAYLPPGVPASYLTQVDRCTNPVVLKNFFDARFNPDGKRDVITFCDGGESSLGVFDPLATQDDAPEVLLAVDVNGNGRRDSGEPLLVQPYEPFADVGTDGLADAQEPGYDPVTNPDPDGDDYHPIRNPRGTEGNFWRDPGEPFQDVGLDGVATGPGVPADFGEGDGMWTVNPNLLRWVANDAGRNLAALSAADRDRIHLYIDAGIRDFLDSHISANNLVAKLSVLGLPVGVFDGFHGLTGAASDALYDFEKVSWADLPENVYVRYGNPDASDAEIQNGDGRHVGTTQQLVARITTLFGWLNASWPGGDRAVVVSAGQQFLRDQHFVSPTTGRDTPYAVFLPPGYDETPTLRYPVIYFLHGYGMDPSSLIDISGVFSSYMVDPQRPEAHRFQKFIIVYVDGRCRAGDGCETGTFFVDSPVNAQAQMETHLYELVAEIDRRFRTKAPETVEVTP